MSRSTVYLLLALVGTAVPWYFFAVFFQAEGAGGDFIGALFVNGAASGFTSDLLVSSLIFWIFLFREGRRLGMGRLWGYLILNLTIGLSCALPLFLWAREGAVKRASSRDSSR